MDAKTESNGRLIGRRKVLKAGLAGGFGLVVGATSLSTSTVAAGNRARPGLALVIGTDNYARARDLRTPVRDAQAVAGRLENLGYRLHGGGVHADPDRATALGLFREFAAAVPQDGLAFVYVAGHGVAQSGVTYLIPSDDAALMEREDLADQAIALPVLTARLAARPGVDSFVLVDACRANGLRGAGNAVGGSGDLVAPRDGSLTLIYAASPGQIAADGDGGQGVLSPFARAVLHALDAPDRPLVDLFTDVSLETLRLSGGGQTPFQMQVLAGPPLTGVVPAR
ncbi:MAG: caspase domain-containing protein [Cohaesibacteraceae bacterium]